MSSLTPSAYPRPRAFPRHFVFAIGACSRQCVFHTTALKRVFLHGWKFLDRTPRGIQNKYKLPKLDIAFQNGGIWGSVTFPLTPGNMKINLFHINKLRTQMTNAIGRTHIYLHFGEHRSQYYRKRLRRVIAAPPINSPKQSAGTV